MVCQTIVTVQPFALNVADLRRSFESWQKDFTNSLALVSAAHTNMPRSMAARTLQLEERSSSANEDGSGEEDSIDGSGTDPNARSTIFSEMTINGVHSHVIRDANR